MIWLSSGLVLFALLAWREVRAYRAAQKLRSDTERLARIACEGRVSGFVLAHERRVDAMRREHYRTIDRHAGPRP